MYTIQLKGLLGISQASRFMYILAETKGVLFCRLLQIYFVKIEGVRYSSPNVKLIWQFLQIFKAFGVNITGVSLTGWITKANSGSCAQTI